MAKLIGFSLSTQKLQIRQSLAAHYLLACYFDSLAMTKYVFVVAWLLCWYVIFDGVFNYLVFDNMVDFFG